ncbi:MAG: thioesterase family protein [Candidatus Kapabacteria bacterium]|nr:thioesterase family protein [Candidatus Kapabacteria bacterium]
MNVSNISHITQFRVRYADTDKMGVVYNGNYLSFFETGRTELMRNFGLPYVEVENAGYLLPLIDSYVKYLNPAKYDDILQIKATLEMESPAKIKFIYNIFTSTSTIAEGFTRHTFVDSNTMKPVRPPKIFTDIINAEQA